MWRTVPLPLASTKQHKQPFLDTVPDATSKDFVCDDDVQVLHGFPTTADAKAYLPSELFARDVVGGLTPLLNSAPDVRSVTPPQRRKARAFPWNPLSRRAQAGACTRCPPTAAAPEEARQ